MSRRLKDVPEAEQQMIVFGNVDRIYHFDV
jgi:hypothetical protein